MKKFEAIKEEEIHPRKIFDEYLRRPFLPVEKLRQLYCAADVGIWLGIPSAIIQEALFVRDIAADSQKLQDLRNKSIAGDPVSLYAQ